MIDTETARIMGRAFTLGYAFGQGMRQSDTAAAADCGFAQDEARWITVHPNGEGEGKGRPALIDSESGVVLGGMGGKFTGKKITEARSIKSRIKSARKSATSEKLKAQSRVHNDVAEYGNPVHTTWASLNRKSGRLYDENKRLASKGYEIENGRDPMTPEESARRESEAKSINSQLRKNGRQMNNIRKQMEQGNGDPSLYEKYKKLGDEHDQLAEQYYKAKHYRDPMSKEEENRRKNELAENRRKSKENAAQIKEVNAQLKSAGRHDKKVQRDKSREERARLKEARARADLEKAKASEASKKAGQESKPPKENTSAKMYERAASRKKEKMNSLKEQISGFKTQEDKLFQDQEAECRKDPEASKWMDRMDKKWNEIQEMRADLKQKFPNGRPDESDRDGTAYWNNTESFIESAWKDHDAAHRHFNEAAAPIHEKYDKKYSDLIKERRGVESELEHQQKLLHQLHQRYTRRARQLGEEDFDE